MRRLSLLLLALWLLFPFPARGQTPSPIQVEGPTVVNEFPTRLVVTFHIRSLGSPITRVVGKLQYANRNSREHIQLTFTPGQETDATWEWDTEKLTVPPYFPLTLWLEVQTQDGQRVTTGPYHVVYEDNRFPWKEKRGELLILRWYEGDDAFGDYLFQVGETALQRQLADFGVTLERPFVILVYASEDDFFAWHSYRTEWVGGQAFPSLGAAALIVPPYEEDWAASVLPHELLHLVMGHIIRNPFGRPPAWFEEGMAQHYEMDDRVHEQARERLQKAIREHRVLPLGVMDDPPGQDPETARLWYAQALSMAEWLLESRGEEALQRYIALMQTPIAPRKAFEQGFGLSEEAFYRSWCEHVAADCPLPTPTWTPTPPRPTRAPAQAQATDEPRSPTPTRRPTPTHPPTPSPPAIRPTPTPGPGGGMPLSLACLLGLSCFLLAGLVILLILGIIVRLGVRGKE